MNGLDYMPQPRRCAKCGSGHGLETVHEYVGGKGLVEVTQCVDRTKCWERIDQASGFTPYRETVRLQGDTMTAEERERRYAAYKVA